MATSNRPASIAALRPMMSYYTSLSPETSGAFPASPKPGVGAAGGGAGQGWTGQKMMLVGARRRRASTR